MDFSPLLAFLKINISYTIYDYDSMDAKYEGTYQTYVVPRVGEMVEMDVPGENGDDVKIFAKVGQVYHTLDELDQDIALTLYLNYH